MRLQWLSAPICVGAANGSVDGEKATASDGLEFNLTVSAGAANCPRLFVRKRVAVELADVDALLDQLGLVFQNETHVVKTLTAFR